MIVNEVHPAPDPIPGDVVEHAIITDNERVDVGHEEAFENAVEELRLAYEKIATLWPVGNRAVIHIVFICEKPPYS